VIKQPQIINFYGLTFTNISKKELIDFSTEIVQSGQKKIFHGYSLMFLPKLKSNPNLLNYLQNIDHFLIDGRGIYLLLKFFGENVKEHISLPDFAEILLELSNQNSFRVLLFGASEEINKKAKENVSKNYNNIELFGINGYFSEEDEEHIVDKINDIKADIILIGISTPKKEKFTFDWANRINSKIIVHCGGVIDILAGKTRREPRIIKFLALTWLYRLVLEPKRLFKIMIPNFFIIMFGLVPRIILNKLVRRKDFSIPNYFTKIK